MNEVYHCYIEAMLATTGMIKREDLTKTFGVSLPTATRIFADFRRTYPGVMVLEPSDKSYHPGCSFSTQTLTRRGTTPSEFLSAVRIVFGERHPNEGKLSS